MSFVTSRRFAWGVTFATIALWWATTPGGPGDLLLRHAHASYSDGQPPVPGTRSLPEDRLTSMSTDDESAPQIPPCEPAQVAPPAPAAEAPAANVAPPAPAVNPSALEGTFRLCGPNDPASERAIEQLIAGRGFGATLRGGSDGCAELTITVSPQSSARGRNSTTLSVSGLTVQIVSENGATRAMIGGRR
jgi:hypothetical protein